MSPCPLTTKKCIIKAALQLIIDKGYKGTTTRAIAERAGVNEVTIFRHFGSKKGIIEELVQSYSYVPQLSKLISNNVVFDLEKDLHMISNEYQRLMDDMKEVILIAFREAGLFPEINQEISKVPRQLTEELTHYFITMQKQGKIIKNINIEAQVMNFLLINFGYFMSKVKLGDQVVHFSKDEFLNHSIQLFTRALTP